MSLGSSKSNQSSSSYNQSYGFLKDAYGGQIGTGVGASNALAALLGVGGTAQDQSNQNAAFQNYLNSSGYNFQLQQGQNAINTNNAAAGLLNSGSALKKLNSYGQGLASNYLQQYMAQLSGLSQQGLAAGGIVGGAGNVSNSSGKTSSLNFGY